MAEPMTPEEMAAQVAQADEARRLANSYLQSQEPNASYPGDVPEATPPVVQAPVPAAMSSPPNGTWEAAKKGLANGVKNSALMVASPLGAAANALHDVATQGGMKPAAAPPIDAAIEGSEPAGPSKPGAPVISTKDQPTFLPSYTGSSGPGRLISPAGMRPESDQVSVQQGIPVPEQAKSAMEASFGHNLEAADRAHDANQAYGEQVQFHLGEKLAAEDRARLDHEKVQADRKAQTAAKMAEIQSLNQQAQADIDPDKYWHDRPAFARVIGVIAAALGGFSAGLTGGPNNALNIIENGINREIDAQKFNRTNKRNAADQAEKSLGLNMKLLDNEDQAIDATKASLFANVGTLLDQEAARRGVAMDDANLASLKQGLAEKQAEYYNKVALQEEDKIAKQSTRRWAPAVYSGGGAPDKAHDLPDNVITVPASDHTGNKEVHVAVPKDLHTALATSQGATNAFSAQAKEALDIRRKLREASAKGDADAVRTYWKRLGSLNTDRVNAIAKTRDPLSSVREGEFAIEAAKGVNYTDGMIVPELGGVSSGRLIEKPFSAGDVDKNIQSSVNRAQQQTDERIRGATGQIVKQQVGRDKNGNVFTQWAPTGELYEGRAVMPEKKQVGK